MRQLKRDSTGTDNFARDEDVSSVLVCGNPAAVPNPRITVAIPTFKRPGLLRRAIESALTADPGTFPFDVIIVDNDPSQGPTETSELIESYRDDRLLHYRNSRNLGVFGNLNRCISLARGEWIALLHDDDMLLPTYFTTIESLLGRKSNIGAIAARFHVVDSRDDERGHSIATQVMTPPEGRSGEVPRRRPLHVTSVRSAIHALDKSRLERIRANESVLFLENLYGAPTCGSIFRRELALHVGGFGDTCPSEDWFFHDRMSRRYRVYRSRTALGVYTFGVNATLQPEMPLALIADAVRFRDRNRNRSPYLRWFCGFFELEQNAHLVERVAAFAGASSEGFQTFCEYRVRPVRRALYEAHRALYDKRKKLGALVAG